MSARPLAGAEFDHPKIGEPVLMERILLQQRLDCLLALARQPG
jgi:hypothetical protein